MVVSATGVIRHANRQFARLVDRPREDLVGSQCRELFGELPSFLDTSPEPDDLDATEGYVVLIGPGGEPRTLGSRAVAIRDGRGLIEYVVLFADAMGVRTPVEIDQLGRIADDNPSPVLRIDQTGVVRYANAGSWIVLAQWSTEVGRAVPEWWVGVVRRALESDETQEATLSAGIASILLVFVPASELGYVDVYGVDITRQVRMEEKIRLNATVFESAAEGIAVLDADRRVIDINPAFSEITGFDPAEILGETARFLQSSFQDDTETIAMWQAIRDRGAWHGEVWDRRKSGEMYAKRLSVSVVRDESGVATNYVCLLGDVTTQKKAEDQLHRMAHYDALTDLANRRLFQERLAEAIASSDNTGELVCVMVIDLDDFKIINDTLGHHNGDTLLRIIAGRIERRVRTTDTVARIGGDEFAVILRNLKSTEDAEPVARGLLESICEPTILDPRHEAVFVTASIGIVGYPAARTDIETLLINADSAMYRTKMVGKNSYQFFTEETTSVPSQRLFLQSRLRMAVEDSGITVVYQPQIDVATGGIVGLEALARWTDSERGSVSPGVFIPIAEESGLISRLGELVLRKACEQGRDWLDAGLTVPRLSVNVSAQQLSSPTFLSSVTRIIRESRFDPNLLAFELTENMPVREPDIVSDTLSALGELGISLAIDDFGTKYASLAILTVLPVSVLKIDQTFVRDLPGDERAAELASTVIAIGKSLSMSVVAEGVEREDQMEFLIQRGCRFVQGHYYSPGVPASVLHDILRIGRMERNKHE